MGSAARAWPRIPSQDPLSVLPPSRGTAGSRGTWTERGASAAWPACSASSPSSWGPSSSCSTFHSASEVTSHSLFPCPAQAGTPHGAPGAVPGVYRAALPVGCPRSHPNRSIRAPRSPRGTTPNSTCVCKIPWRRGCGRSPRQGAFRLKPKALARLRWVWKCVAG